MSEVLLKRFTSDGRLMVYDCQTREERPSRPNAEGWVRDFVNWDKAESEARWREVEGPIGPVLSALDAVGEAVLDDPRHIELLTAFFALHMARSKVLSDIWGLALKPTLGQGDYRLQPVVLDNPPPDLRLPRSRAARVARTSSRAGRGRRGASHNGEPGWGLGRAPRPADYSGLRLLRLALGSHQQRLAGLPHLAGFWAPSLVRGVSQMLGEGTGDVKLMVKNCAWHLADRGRRHVS